MYKYDAVAIGELPPAQTCDVHMQCNVRKLSKRNMPQKTHKCTFYLYIFI